MTNTTDQMLTEALCRLEEMEESLSEAHIALGGDGEWAYKVPPEEPPNSGHLCFDVPELARQIMAKNEQLRKAVERLTAARSRVTLKAK